MNRYLWLFGMSMGWLALSAACSTKSDQAYAGSQHTIVCKHWPNQCYYKAQEKCMGSYMVVSSSETERTGGPWGRYREFTTIIKCK